MRGGNLSAPPPEWPDCVNPGDTGWVLLSTILVLGMMPALAFFESGLLRRKNALSIITQILSGVIILLSMWFVIGFSLVYGADHGGVIGDGRHAFYMGLGTKCLIHAPTIPGLAFANFQGMFAAITPLLMTGTFAERMRFRYVLSFMVLWELIVFYPLAHWVWGGGWLDSMGALDFAGGIVIHTSAGASSLVIAKFLGKRIGFDEVKGEFRPHNIPLATVGAALLWMGWYGFNAGSALSSGSLAAWAVSTTTIASCASALVWICLSVTYHNHVRTLDVLNGAIAGLAGITPASGYIMSHWAAVLGVIIVLASFYGVALIKEKLEIDDALDVSSIHGIPGVVGSLGIGIFADVSVNPQSFDAGTPGGGNGWINGNPKLLGLQVLAVLVAAVWAGFWTYVLLLFKNTLSGTRGVKVTADQEQQGLDKTEHGEHDAYHDEDEYVMVLDSPGPIGSSDTEVNNYCGADSSVANGGGGGDASAMAQSPTQSPPIVERHTVMRMAKANLFKSSRVMVSSPRMHSPLLHRPSTEANLIDEESSVGSMGHGRPSAASSTPGSTGVIDRKRFPVQRGSTSSRTPTGANGGAVSPLPPLPGDYRGVMSDSEVDRMQNVDLSDSGSYQPPLLPASSTAVAIEREEKTN